MRLSLEEMWILIISNCGVGYVGPFVFFVYVFLRVGDDVLVVVLFGVGELVERVGLLFFVFVDLFDDRIDVVMAVFFGFLYEE